jgi:PAS domain S-box-containing protein
MSETVTMTVEELQALRERVSVLAKASAHLRLINSMLARLSSATGLSNVIENTLAILMETIGGSNLILYYLVDGSWNSRDVFGVSQTMVIPSDPLVQRCIQTGAFVRSQPIVDSHPYGETRHESWAFPLIVQKRMIGTVIMEGVQLADVSIQTELQPFFVYAALLLGNEISNYSVLEIAHAELMESHQELECEIEARQEAEEFYRILFEQSPDGVVLVDPETKVPIRFNSAAHLQLGYSREEFAALTLLDIDALDTAEDIERRTQYFLTQEFATFETLHRTKDGQLHNVVVTGKTVTLEGTGLILALFRDVTAAKKMEEELLKSQKLESVGVLAGGIAHDFNNLLTAIVGNISLAMNCLEEGSRPAILLAASEKACLRARDLTQQLLTFAKGGEPVRHLSSVAGVVQESAGFALRGSGAACEFTIPEELWNAEIDQGQIGQVIHNLIINAEQAMSGSGVIRIFCTNESVRTDSGDTERWVRIDIQDNGIGIQQEHLHKVFDPYFTTKQKGSGLGLASSYSIIRKHNGRIEVESTPGNGTVFHVFLPAAAGEVVQNEKENAAVPAGCGRILVMDDEQIVLDVVAEMLRLLGHDVQKVRDGAEAIQAYRDAMDAGRRFDVVVLDLTVPGGIGGREAVKLLHQIDPEVRAVVSSGYASDTTVSDFRSFGFAGVLSKPYTLRDMEKVVADLLR